MAIRPSGDRSTPGTVAIARHPVFNGTYNPHMLEFDRPTRVQFLEWNHGDFSESKRGLGEH
jgi:hypothetical protein